MVFHLAAPYIQDHLSQSLRSWKPGGTLTVRVKYRGPFRLPAVRVVGVLSSPAPAERPGGGPKPRGPAAGAAAAAAAAERAAALWDQSRAVAETAVTYWNTIVETHSQRWSHSLQTLQRVGSRLLRSVSNDSVADGGGGGGGAPGGAAAEGGAPGGERREGGGGEAAAPAFGADGGGDAAAAVAALAAQEALLQAQLEQLGQLQASLSRFVTTASRKEVNFACMLADLSNIAYDVNQVLDGSLLEARHGLRLVACSHPEHAPTLGAALEAAGYACALPAHPAAMAGGGAPAAAAGAEDGEGDAEALFELQLHPQWGQWEAWGGDDGGAAGPWAPLPAGAPTAAPAPTCWEEAAGGALHGGYEYGGAAMAAAAAPPLSPRAPAVASAMAFADDRFGEAAVCSAAPRAAAPRPRSRVGSFDNGAGAAAAPRLCSSAVAFDCAMPAAPAMQRVPTAELFAPAPRAPPPAAAPWRPAPDHGPPAAAPALDAAAPVEPPPAAAAAQAAAAAAAAAQYPADWFVCDAPAEGGAPPTRYFVIQGSITVDHWRINLTIDPVPFEDASTGVKVHRGVYAAALEMYASLAPLVREHLACAGPGAKVAFTGHSLGGSLATVLTLIMIRRGDLPASAVASVHTFGAPAIFCEAGAGRVPAGGRCGDAACSCGGAAHGAAAPGGGAAAAAHPHVGALLPALGLEPHVITNVVMHRDIVPRAFVCDYSLVADLLKSWLPSFKAHTGLAACQNHKVLYHFVGDVEVLQPPLGRGFTLADEGHFMLPPEPALYKLTEPSCPLPRPQPAPAAAAPGAAPPRRELGLPDAILAFMNTPHPLQTLKEVRAYGPSGSISRFHNPQNYTDALASLL
ncbi:MAG: class 3-domain-containing protein [Monoraphidium minutum]|nr:MAG: class 3-domain-containing protein [Monoraphidium minutum]